LIDENAQFFKAPINIESSLIPYNLYWNRLRRRPSRELLIYMMSFCASCMCW